MVKQQKATSDEEQRQALVRKTLWGRLQHFSRNLIYVSMMRAGGEPFGAPFEVGVPSLTERAVRYFKQRGFFGFETLEKLKNRSQRNKFTRHGAAPFRGAYGRLPAVQGGRGFVARFISYLRENRFFLFTFVPPGSDAPATRRGKRDKPTR